MVLLERASAALTTAAAAAFLLGRICFASVSAFALDVGRPSLAEAAAVRALRDWTALLVDVCKGTIQSASARADKEGE